MDQGRGSIHREKNLFFVDQILVKFWKPNGHSIGKIRDEKISMRQVGQNVHCVKDNCTVSLKELGNRY